VTITTKFAKTISTTKDTKDTKEMLCDHVRLDRAIDHA